MAESNPQQDVAAMRAAALEEADMSLDDIMAKRRAGGGGAYNPDVDLSLEELIQRNRGGRGRGGRFGGGRGGRGGRGGSVPTNPEEKDKRRERFGLTKTDVVEADVDEVKVLEARMEAPFDLERRPHVVHVYGVDFMSTEEILQFFGESGGQAVEWINDSSCNVIFRDDDAARRAVLTQGDILNESAAESVDPTDFEKFAWHWHKAKKPFVKEGIDYTLQFRIATVDDRKSLGKPKRSRFLWNRKDTLGVKSDVRKQIAKPAKKGRGGSGVFSYADFLKEVTDQAVGGTGGTAEEALGAPHEGEVKEEEAPAEQVEMDYGDL